MMPCVVYIVGCVMKVETFKRTTMLNMFVITAGVTIASYGELNFNTTGFLLLLGSIAAEVGHS
jgi:drug/metabolite transporter (DMT)-like permease